MNRVVSDIKALDGAIADDLARIAEIQANVSYSKRKRDILAGGLTDAEKAELDPSGEASPANTSSVGESPTPVGS